MNTEMLRNLEVESEVFVFNNSVTHIFRLSGNLCSTDAMWLKEKLRSFEYSETILLDLSHVVRTDLIAVNALAAGHKKHTLGVVMPRSAEAAEIFHLTKFNQILNLLPTLPVAHENGVYA
ncbi:hypothetical protein ACFSUS_27370 [Spirosoma soli]|uniref:STAS domain-containing protein n=1 Tax=Spirosoma soli TaxID=1770529 RepID=A0ABW5MBE9_9BACT